MGTNSADLHSLHKFTQLGKLSSNGRVDESLRRYKSASVSASAHSRSARQLAYHSPQLVHLFVGQQKVPKLFRFLAISVSYPISLFLIFLKRKFSILCEKLITNVYKQV